VSRTIPWILLLTLLPATARAADPPAAPPEQSSDHLQVYDEIQVTDRASDMVGVADSASEGVTGRQELEQRPILRPGELLETVPGVIITQHSGSGKANQYFLRGFNLDHGTDFRITVDDVPVNMPSHGHGQGYSDLNFLIPELVDTVRYKKGAYYADEGDFSAAGAAEFTYVNSLPKGILALTPGEFDYDRLLAADSRKWGRAISWAPSRSAATTAPGCIRTTTASSTASCVGTAGTPATASP
jgi:TonB-dependent Receptor Plug Domain